jgi:hypothetical protein
MIGRLDRAGAIVAAAELRREHRRQQILGAHALDRHRDAFAAGVATRVQEAQSGPLTHLPDLPGTAPDDTAAWIRRVLAGLAPVPQPVAQQVAHIVALARATFPPPATGATTPTAHCT